MIFDRKCQNLKIEVKTYSMRQDNVAPTNQETVFLQSFSEGTFQLTTYHNFVSFDQNCQNIEI